MAEIADGGGGGGKHAKKGRGARGNPRIDMTPMVDLAFLLLTFFVLTSNLNKAKTMEMTVPKKANTKEDNVKINYKLANTILLDGNKNGIIYYYPGMLGDTTQLYELSLDPKKGVRKMISVKNAKVQGEMKFLREVYKSGKFAQAQYDKLKQLVKDKTTPNDIELAEAATGDSVNLKRKREDYSEAIGYLDRDFKAGEMTDTTFKKVYSVISNDNEAPFFIIKWCGDATYADVINVVDELKIGDANKYALTTFDPAELRSLSAKTGIQYPELLALPPEEAEPDAP